MDPSRFDGLARGIASFTSRRTTLAGLLAGLAVPLLGEGESEARKQRNKRRHDHDHRHVADKKQGHARHGVDAEKKKKKKKKCKPPTTKCGKTCVNTATDRANCGACGKACAAGESCKGGVCTCDGAICAGCCAGGACQAGTSNGQCGAGGTVCKTCPSGTSCVGGVCTCGAGGPCGAGQTCCAGVCVTTQTDDTNCGGCGNSCPAGEACSGGNCGCGSSATCTSGDTCCSDVCTDTGTDFTHCGSCGNACDSQTADACQDGNCTCGGLAACEANQRCCGGQCVDTQTSFSNCNGCGFACDHLKADSCVGGSCKCGQFNACAGNEQCCGGQCVNITTVQNCGSCGNVCPGYQTANSNVTCQNGTTCAFSCQGDSYDVDGNEANGCEALYTSGAHTQETATRLPEQDCTGSGVTPSRTLFSDQRTHENLQVAAFNTAKGAAPQWWVIKGTGGFCNNDLNVTLNLSTGSGHCYKLTVKAGINAWTAQTVNGVANITRNAPAYQDDTDIFFGVEKTCDASTREAATYTIAYAL